MSTSMLIVDPPRKKKKGEREKERKRERERERKIKVIVFEADICLKNDNNELSIENKYKAKTIFFVKWSCQLRKHHKFLWLQRFSYDTMSILLDYQGI